MRRLMRRMRSERGATAVLVAILLLPLMGIMAVAVDVGAMYAERAQLQNAADAGALAAARYCAYHSDCTDAAAQAGARSAAAEVTPGNILGGDPTIEELVFGDNTVRVPTATLGMSHPFAAVLGLSQSDVRAAGTAEWDRSFERATVVPFAVGECAFDASTLDGERQRYDLDWNKYCPGGVPGVFGWLAGDTSSCLKDIGLLQFVSIVEGNGGDCGVTDQDLAQAAAQLGCDLSAFSPGSKNIQKLFYCFVGKTLLVPVYGDNSECPGTAPDGKAYCITKFAAFEMYGLHVDVRGGDVEPGGNKVDYCPSPYAPCDLPNNWGSQAFDGRFISFVTPEDDWILAPPRPIVRLIG
ncbi:Tad domain-containing protein [Microbacterium soli]|uniref:Putative Flp pilus-assembly TadG-like N-terminal domain-containing protein n=1 Tax=Microbacterium soli TaxID=446075 RepID=A0ABP7N712_9MICO